MAYDEGEGSVSTATSAPMTPTTGPSTSSAHIPTPPTPRNNQRRRTSPSDEARIRVSPYPQRRRTPPQRNASPPDIEARQRSCASSGQTPSPPQRPRLQLVVQPIVKNAVSQRESSGKTLEYFVANGSTFAEIIQKLWDEFSGRVKGLAVKQDDVWSIETPTMASWRKVMQFKLGGHLVDNTKSEQSWNRWLAAKRGETVKLLVYEYGKAIAKTKDIAEFMEACIRPQDTDRSGATAESSLRDVIAQLKDIWGATFQGNAAVWRMWANHVTRNLDRSTWDNAILASPPDYVARMLQPTDSQFQEQLVGLTRSAQMALDCVKSSLADNKQIRQDLTALGQRLDCQERSLEARKAIIEAFLADMPLPSAQDVINLLEQLENIDDHEHQE